MTLSIIILSFESPALLKLCLSSVARALPIDIESEVIVVDNKTSIETRYAAEEFRPLIKNLVFIALKKNEGYTKAVNEGFNAARGEYVMYANYDVVLEPESITTMYEYLRVHPKTGLVGPKLLNFNGTDQASCFRFYSPWTIICRRFPFIPGAKKTVARFEMRDQDLSRARDVDWVSGAIFMTPKTVINKVGCMDERFFHYFSDVDWSRRFWENGYAVTYLPAARVFHFHGQHSRGRLGVLAIFHNRPTQWHIQDGMKYFLKHGLRLPHYAPHD